MENIPPDEQQILSGNPEQEPEEEPPNMQMFFDKSEQALAMSIRKNGMKQLWERKTFFGTYESRLQALAIRHNLEPAYLKALVEDAFGTCDTPPAEQESKLALMKLAKLKIGPCSVNWLFQVHILK